MTNYLCTLRGSISTGTLAEIFSHSLCVQSAADQQSVAFAIQNTWEDTWGAAGAGIGKHFTNLVTYDDATAAKILDLSNSSKPVLSAASHAPFVPPMPGHAGIAQSLPSQCAIAVSLTGGLRSNGAPSKGRFFLPPPGAITNNDGVLQNVDRDQLATDLALFFNSLAAAGHWPSIWSRTDATLRNVSTLRVGNKIDTIRSRRNALPETYISKAISQPA